MDKIDYKKVFREAYGAKATPALVHVPPMQCLMIDGRGDPNTEPRFAAAVETLFGLAYTLKFQLKQGPMALDFAVMPLEGLWWADDMAHFAENRDAWHWTLMIMQPPVVDAAKLAAATETLRRKKAPPLLHEVRLEAFDEGDAVQLLHTGPFSAEGPAIERLHAFAAERGDQLRGKHHEIYLSDMRRTAPEKLKTVLRQPIQKRGED